MRPVKLLGMEYVPIGKLDVEARNVVVGLNLIGLALLFVFGWLFLQVVSAVRPEMSAPSLAAIMDGLTVWTVLLTLAIVLLLHELVHGFFFWFFTRERPRFGFHLVYAYAAAPDWYLPRNQFLVTGSAPFLVMTVTGLALLPIIPYVVVPFFYLALTANAAGSVGDFLVSGWLISQPNTTLARDTGLSITLYGLVTDEVRSMHQRWQMLVTSYGVLQEEARGAFGDLVKHYSGRDRQYHNLEHVREVLEVIEGLKSLAKDLRSIQLATWYHDVIYDTHFKDNEARSAVYARQFLLRLGIPATTADRVQALILATASHLAPDGDVDCQILLDADLSSLGADEETFARQSQALRKEFGWIPEKEYNLSRVRFLSGILDRERIYIIDQIYREREEQARSNIGRTIAELS